MTDPSQSSVPIPETSVPSPDNALPSQANSKPGNKAAVPSVKLPPGTTNPAGSRGFIWRPVMNGPINMNQPRFPFACPPGFQQMRPPQQIYPPQMYPPPQQMYLPPQQMYPPPQQMYPPPQQMYPPPQQMYPPPQQMYPPPQMYLPQQMYPPPQIYPPGQMNQYQQINHSPNTRNMPRNSNNCCKLTQTQARPTLAENALTIIDTLVSYEESPCNTCDQPEVLEKPCESDGEWLCGLVKEILCSLGKLAGQGSSCCEDTYNSSFKQCEPCREGDGLAPGKSSMKNQGANFSTFEGPMESFQGSMGSFQGSMESFPDDLSVTQYFSNSLANVKQKTALVEEKTVHTYRHLNDITNKIAEVLKMQIEGLNTMNPDGDTVIGICIPPSDKLIFTIFAILKLGAAYVPFDLAMPEDRIVRIVKDCKPLLIVSDSHGNTIEHFDPVRDLVKVIGYSDIMEMVNGIVGEPDESIIIQPVAGLPALSERTAIVLYTSGSSGEPKGVRLSHKAILNRLSWQWKVFPYNSNEQCVFKTSLTFVDSVSEILGPLLQGYPVVIFSKLIVQNPSAFIQRLKIYSVTRVVLVPSLMRAIFQTLKLIDPNERENILASVKLWIVSGEALQKELVDEFFEFFPHKHVMANFYGSTEIMGDVTYISYDSDKSVSHKTVDHQIPIGICIYNTIVYILDHNMQHAPENESGEIYVAGYNLAKGYVGIPDSDRFIENPFSTTPGFTRLYRTGDFGRITKTHDGTKVILYEGRTDSQIKVRGQRVDLNEIEYPLTQLPLVMKGVVLCYHPGLPDQEIVAFVLAEPEVTAVMLKNLLAKKLRPYEMPVIRLVKEFPYLINGKTDRQRLLRSFQLEKEERGEFDDWDSLGLPKEDADAGKSLIEAISEVTGRSIQDIVVSLEESFYNLGGTSLNSIEVILKLKQRHYDISVSDFVLAKTILEIIDSMVSTKGRTQGKHSIVRIDTIVYVAEELNNSMEEDVIKIISYSFSQKGDLEAYTNSTYQDFSTLIKSIWEVMVQKGISFVIKRTTDDQIVGAALNFDVYDEPEEVDAAQGILYVLEMLELIESRQKERLPKGIGKLLHNFMMGVKENLSESDNVKIIEMMEGNVIKLGESLDYEGIFATNTNPLTKAICRDIYGYEVLHEYQVNQFIAEDGTRPWLLAPDTFTIICCWKKLN